MRHAGLRAQEGAVEVGLEDVLELGVAGLHHRLEHGDAGVVHELVDAAELRRHLGDAGRDLRGIAHVGVHGQHGVGAVERGHAALQRLVVDVQQGDVVAAREEPLADGQADAARASGDDGDGGVGGERNGRGQVCLLEER